MSSHSKSTLGRFVAMVAFTGVVLGAFGTRATAQDQPTPKWELFGGYSFLYPNTTVSGVQPLGLLPLSSELESNPRGAGASITYNFNRWFGFTLDGSRQSHSGEVGVAMRIDDNAFWNVSVGPKITLRTRHFSPFFEALIGNHDLSPDAFHSINKLGFMVGAGIDINLNKHLALRLIRADYVYSNYRYGPSDVTPETDLRGARAESGLVILLGGGEPPMPPSAACSIQPNEIFAGETVTATASATNFDPKGTIAYSWNGTGVKVTGSDASSQIDTTGLQPGAYVVTANLHGGKRGSASCSARFTVKVPHPPVISCSANPTSVQTGGTSSITSSASSPDGRRLIYSYSTTAGDISGNNATATLNIRDAQPGDITVTCNVNDDRVPALTASATAIVTVEAPPPPPAPAPEIAQLETRLALHSIYFPTARPTPANPGGGLVESQEKILETLAQDFTKYLSYKPDAHLTLFGHADKRGSEEFNKALTERRVERTKNFLVEHGVPANAIDTQSLGKDDNLTADQVKELMMHDPDLSPEQRKEMISNLPVMILANNRRVDVSLSTTGQQSVRLYPFNANDFLALIDTKGAPKTGKTKKKTNDK
jgi:outer membrane protein OmpA-like peptidoglycan-associated protein/opacity protein-like surface antigen